jgi:hypothetical protein
MEKIKSTSNYFVIGWYEDKFDECNSINYVDSSITSTNFVAYCGWYFIENKTLCKSQIFTNQIQSWYSIPNFTCERLGEYFDIPNTIFTNNTQQDMQYTISCNFLITRYVTPGYNDGGWHLYYKIGSTTTDLTGKYTWTEKTYNNSALTVTIPAWQTFCFYVSDYWLTSITWTNIVYKTQKQESNKIYITWKPASIIPVWNETSVITEWDVNGEWFQQPTKITTFTQEPQKKQWQIYYDTSTWKLMFCNWTKRWEVTVTYPS